MELFYFEKSASAISQSVDCDQELREGVVQRVVKGDLQTAHRICAVGTEKF